MPNRRNYANRLILGVFFTLSLAVIASIAPAVAAAQPAAALAAPQIDAALGPDPRPLLAADCTLAPFQLECEALVALYTDTDGANWINTLAADFPWNVDNNPCTWFGVTCNGTSHVIDLDLNSNNLVGTIPTQIGDLTALIDLSLEVNQLSGSIPVSLGNLSSLENLDLSINLLSGSIPGVLGSLTWLTDLVLANNQLTGSIPVELGDFIWLQNLDLRDNFLSGSIPAALGNLTDLQYLGLSNNQLTGSIPVEIGNLTSLFSLIAANNLLSGSIPTELGNLTLLTTLQFDNNINLAGPLPDTLTSLTVLASLHYGTTGMCEPQGAAFLAWLGGIGDLDPIVGTGTLCAEVDLAVSKTTTVNEVDPGESIPYTITVSNIGTGDVVGALVSDTIPASLTSASWTCNSFGGAICSSPGFGDISETVDIPSGGTLIYFLTAQVDAPATGILSNTASVSIPATVNAIDGITANNSATDTTDICDLLTLSYTGGGVDPTAAPLNSFGCDTGRYLTGETITLTAWPDGNHVVGSWSGTDNNLSTALTNTVTMPAVPHAAGVNYIPYFPAYCTVQSSIPLLECAALVAFYDSTDGANWKNTTKVPDPDKPWLVDADPCTWYGVTCTSGHVTAIDLHLNSLSGTLPVELGDLAELVHFNLFYNNITGSPALDPTKFTKLEYLDLSWNELAGSIPVELGDLTSLQYLDLSANQFTGSIPVEVGNLTNLQVLSLSANDLTGSIPAAIGNLTNLTLLALSSNSLTGSIPTSIGNLVDLMYLNFGYNDLTGSIPTEIGNLASLDQLILLENSLSGSIPTSIGNLSNLTYLELRSNNLTGSIPTEIGNLASLRYLIIYKNSLSGSIPSTIGNLTNLRTLAAYANSLSGGIPATIGNLANLTYLDLSSNQLSGGIPTEIGNLSSLEFLHLYNNLLTGIIPASLGNLTNLYYLALSKNQLTGTVPISLGDLTNLTELFLSENPGLTGPLPQELTNITTPGLVKFYYHTSNLCRPNNSTFFDWFMDISIRGGTGFVCGIPTTTPILSPTISYYGSGGSGSGTATQTLLLPTNTPTMIGPFQTLTVLAFRETLQATTPRTATPTLSIASILKTNIALTATAPYILDPDATLSYAARTLTVVSMEETVIANGGTPIAMASATATDTPTPVGGAGSIGEGTSAGGLFSRFGNCLILPILLILAGAGLEIYNRFFKNRKAKSGEDVFSF